VRSAFGVEHGISKSFKKLEPKLARANSRIQAATPNGRSQSLEGRFQENYAQWRGSAGRAGSNQMFGKPGASKIKIAQGSKEGAGAMVTGIGNMTRRAGRLVP
jgi:hypothetical protein